MTRREAMTTMTAKAQQLWWVFGLMAAFSASFGFRAYTPSARLTAVEARVDTLYSERAQMRALGLAACEQSRNEVTRELLRCPSGLHP